MPLPDMDAQAAGAWSVFFAQRDSLSARNTLLLIYAPIAQRGAHSEARAGGTFYRNGKELDEDDLLQLAMLCLLDLINSYDHAHNDSFTKYASPLIRLRIKAAVRSLGWVSRHGRRLGCRDNRISGDLPPPRLASCSSYDGGTVFDITPSPYEGPTMPVERADFIDAVMRKLPNERDRQVFSLKFLDRLTSKAIGRYIGRSESMVTLILRDRVVPAIAAAFPDAPGGCDGVKERLIWEMRSNRAGEK